MRPALDRYFIDLARLVASRATCLRRAVGCVLVNARGHVLATGYNGVAAGLPHCNELTGYDVCGDLPSTGDDKYTPLYDHACTGAAAASGEALNACEAIHAEQNALLQCRDVYAIATAYVTVSPCLTCVKLLMNTACRRIVFVEVYAPQHDAARALWDRQLGRSWEKIDEPTRWEPLLGGTIDAGSDRKESVMSSMRIVTEGILGYWHYHISDDETPSRALCGARVMRTSIPLTDWGQPFGEHFPKRPTYCNKCDSLK